MRYLKLFENFRDIDAICKKYGIRNYIINSDGLVDVEGDVNLFNKNLVKLPVRFGKVTGDFYCDHNQLTSLEGGPRSVGYFNCGYNQLTSLEGAPKEVAGDFYCDHNQLTSLEGGPRSVGYFNCSNNQLTSLEGAPQEVCGSFNCGYNQLRYLEGSPQEVGGVFFCHNNQLRSLVGGPKEVGGYLDCVDNPIHEIYKLFNNYRKYKDSLDYDYLRGTNIVKSRFREALAEIGKKLPDKITGYNYI